MQLKPQATTSASRLAIQTSLAAAGLLGLALAVTAAHGVAQLTPAAGPGQFRIELDHTSNQSGGDGKTRTQRQRVVLVQDEGKAARFKTDLKGAATCDVSITVKSLDSGKVSVDMPMTCDGQASNPRMITELGKMASVEIGSAVGVPKTSVKFALLITR